MRVALAGIGTRGDVQPLIVLGRELQRRGHDVVVGVPPNLVDFASRAELAAQPVGPDSEAFLQSLEGREMLASGNVKAFLTALGKVGHDNLELSLRGLLSVMDRADLVVSGTLSEEAVAAVGEGYRIPVVFLHHAPKRRTRAYPAYLATTRQLPGMLNLMMADFLERVTWKALGADVNTIRSRVGLAPVTTTVARRTIAAGLLELQAYSSVLAPGIRDYGSDRPLIGFLSLSEDDRRLLGEAAVEPDLDAWLARGEAPAYFGFGSMPVRDPRVALEMIGQVTERLGLRALISAGWSHLTPTAGVNDRLRVVGALNHDAVLPRCRLAVHHGGSGTTAATVTAGLATLACSVCFDQPFWGERLRALGAGAHVRFAALNASTLEKGLRRILQPQVTRRARDLGAALRRETNVAAYAADLIEARMTKRLVKTHHDENMLSNASASDPSGRLYRDVLVNPSYRMGEDK